MPFYEKNGLRYYQFSSFERYQVPHAIFTRHGGVSQFPWYSLNTGGTVGDAPDAVRTNLIRIFNVFGRDFSSRYDGWQVHGDHILTVTEPRPEGAPHEKVDGLISNHSSVTLLMRFADCVPVMLYDPVHQAVGIVHAGWKGTVLKIAEKAVARMEEVFGTTPQDVLGGIGPSIGPEDYEVGMDVVEAVREAFPGDWSELVSETGGSYYLNLWAANEMALRSGGVTQIETAGISTYSHVSDWFSHRREQGKTGRFAALITAPGVVE